VHDVLFGRLRGIDDPAMILSLPYPPSVNTYWRTVAGRTMTSKAGRDYRKAVISECLPERVRNHGKPLTGRLHATITAYPPDRRRRDLDNLPKAILDALAHAGIYVDDSQIDRLLIIRGPIERDGRVHIELIELDGARVVY